MLDSHHFDLSALMLCSLTHHALGLALWEEEVMRVGILRKQRWSASLSSN
jgi:hypothetical protein